MMGEVTAVQADEWDRVEAFLLSRNFRDFCMVAEPPNLFEILGIGGNEILNSRMLAYLFDAGESHGCGARILRDFLAEVIGDPANRDNARAVRHRLLSGSLDTYAVSTEAAFANDSISGRIDLLIHSPADRIVVGIENKVWAGEQADQVARYQEYLCSRYGSGYARFLIFLSPSGRPPSTVGMRFDGTCPVLTAHHGMVASAIGRWLERSRATARWVLAHFKDHLERHIAMEGNELRQRAREIWSNPAYREALQALIANRPGIGDEEVRGAYEAEVRRRVLEATGEEPHFWYYPTRGALREIKVRLKSWDEKYHLPFTILFHWYPEGEPDVILAVFKHDFDGHAEGFARFAAANPEFADPDYPEIPGWSPWWRWVRKYDTGGGHSKEGTLAPGVGLAANAAERAVSMMLELDRRIRADVFSHNQ